MAEYDYDAAPSFANSKTMHCTPVKCAYFLHISLKFLLTSTHALSCFSTRSCLTAWYPASTSACAGMWGLDFQLRIHFRV